MQTKASEVRTGSSIHAERESRLEPVILVPIVAVLAIMLLPLLIPFYLYSVIQRALD